ncbi:MAG: hypothetical protein DRQ24_10500 [Candidatus Latescibacterota bacterium]|nr:MAG: hypothetical protein DRQ24_10500 [Candidatus Latescibacterota bacterium]
MKVKIFKESDLKDCIDKVKNELGEDALIISTKKKKEDDGKEYFEIIASNSENEFDILSELKKELVRLKDLLIIRTEFNNLLNKLIFDEEVLNLYLTLLKKGVCNEYLLDILEEENILSKIHDKRYNCKALFMNALYDKIEVENGYQIMDKPKIIALVGTTGVGKTTTVAKLAAIYMLNKKRNIGIISIDNFRIGAKEQIGKYADIMGIPFFQAFTHKDLNDSINYLSQMDIILVDTAGQSQNDKNKLEYLRRLFSYNHNLDIYLLLSVSSDEAVLLDTIDKFSPLRFKGYIFTKVDEAISHGKILNILIYKRKPISYITNGQDVPEDIEVADKEKILNIILKGKIKNGNQD